MKFSQVVAVVSLAIASASSFALNVEAFSASRLESAQSSGKPIAVHFHAEWCPTCRAQTQVINSLKSDARLGFTVLVANYDDEKALKKQLGVRVQSTLVVFKGKKETARLAGDTTEEKIRAALLTAL